ncbi:MAG: hypothetical protein ACRC2K_06835 [Clostridium sp.]
MMNNSRNTSLKVLFKKRVTSFIEKHVREVIKIHIDSCLKEIDIERRSGINEV